MTFTRQDRAALAQARRLAEQIGAKEQEAIDEVANACLRACLILAPDKEWRDVCSWVDALRDALEPFDSGMREAAPVYERN